MPGTSEVTSSTSSRSTKPSTLTPSPRMLRAALSGLMTASAFGCSDSNDSQQAQSAKQDLSDEQLRAMCADMVADAKQATSRGDKADNNAGDRKAADLDALCEDRVREASAQCQPPELDKLCQANVSEALAMQPPPDTTKLCAQAVKEAQAKATAPKTADEKTISAEQREYTFAELTKLCDERGGYTQVHAACGGQNTCQGFSYGDWGPGAAILTEHSCSGANGCLGLSCVVLPEGKYKEKSGKELYDLEFGDTEPNHCSGCHAPHVDDAPQLDQFTVYVLEGSTRSEKNWLDRTAAEQERIVAFGAHSTLSDGTAMQNMAPYNKVLSRKEVERVVAHLRTLKPVIQNIKTKDPAPSAGMTK
jgi:hypothetical protein